MPFPIVPIIKGATQVVRMVAPRVAKTLAKKIKKSIDTKDTSIPGRETNSISVGKVRRKRAKNKVSTIVPTFNC